MKDSINRLNRYFRNKDNKERAFFKAILIITFIYIVVYVVMRLLHLDAEIVTKPLTTVLALISAVAFWLQFNRTQRLNESNFIMNLNNQFITNEDMSHIEHVLELYYNQYEVALGDKTELDISEVEKISLELNLSRSSEDCQKMINYLVYLEALAAMIDQQIIRLNVVDDLLSYRFFLAVNNPVIQDWELLKYREYYQGIYKLAELWTNDHIEREIKIPVYQFRFTEKNREYLQTLRPITKVKTSVAQSKDSKLEIAACIYDADRYIYPEAFGDNRKKAVKYIARLIGMNNTIFDYKNIVVAKYNEQICGICMSSEPSHQPKEQMQKTIGLIRKRLGEEFQKGQLQEGFTYAADNYFKKIGTDLPENTIEIVALCVDEGFRRKGVASRLLEYVINDEKNKGKDFVLTVLQDNETAIKLYKKYGFKDITDRSNDRGFAAEGLERPYIYVMKRTAN